MNARLAAYAESLRSDQVPHTESALSWSGGSLAQQFRSSGLPLRCVALLGSHALETILVLASWALIGAGALSGRLDPGWLAAWALCIITMIPLRSAARWLEGVVAVGVGGLLRERLLAGALGIDADFIRRKGTGELLGDALEVEQIERLAAAGGIGAALAAVELAAAVIALAYGVAPAAQIVLLLAFAAGTTILLLQNTQRRLRYTDQRFDLTHRLVENMIAHRTRAVQQASGDRHRQDDSDHSAYLESSSSLDRSTALIDALLPRGYLLVALLVLAPSLVAHADLATQAITVGGILLSAAAMERIAFGFSGAASAWIAWRRVRSLLDAAHKPAGTQKEAVPRSAGAVLTAQDVRFTHAGRLESALSGCTLTLAQGDFVLLEGASGSGKSTLAAILAGLRKPTGGVLLAGGLDPQTLGEDWRKLVALAPQYHDNHVLCAPLSFNLLMGRPLPHTAQDLEDARAVCEELGLGSLLERMPSGLEQIVGETGWQLSQGERSRVFLARALLQDAQVVLLDETFAALDPENLERCMDCAMRRARTLLVIAHP